MSLERRRPTEEEAVLVRRAGAFFGREPVRALALLDGNTVVFSQFSAPASGSSMYYGFSIGKTVTAMAVGKAICAGKLALTSKASDLIEGLRGKALGQASVFDLLRMASGSAVVNPDSTILSPDQLLSWEGGEIDLMDVLESNEVSQAERVFLSSRKPGERFRYKSTDPMVLGAMTSRAVGMSWVDWVQREILDAMGAAAPGIYAQDRFGTGQSDSGLRLRFDDWLRFAVWVKRASQGTGCFADFVRAALSTQIKNGTSVQDRTLGRLNAGYGYLTWTENEFAPDAAFASGWGGQRIGWSTDPRNERMVVAFSSLEHWVPALLQLTRDWHHLSR